jgi:hypothetical protein
VVKAALVAVLLALMAVRGAPVASPDTLDRSKIAPVSAPTAGPAKYCVVAEAMAGQRESLFSIAAATLGNGKRYPEIFALNKDRVQPDGDKLVDPLLIKPGWVLELPADATGPLVRTGPVPVFIVPSQNASTVGPANEAARDFSGWYANGIFLTLLLTLMSVALWLLVRGRRVGLSRGARLALTSYASRGPLAVAGSPAYVGARVGHPSIGPGEHPSTGRAELTALRNASALALPALPSNVRPVGLQARSVSQLPPGRDAAASRPPPAAPPAPPARLAPPGSASPGSLAPRAAATGDRLPMVETEVRQGSDILAVSLIGLLDPSGPDGATWRSAAEPMGPSAGLIPLAVGIAAEGALLVVDLARAPDTITMTGPIWAVRRQARRLAGQLASGAASVFAMVGALGDSLPGGCRPVQGLDDPALVQGGAGAGPRVVFCAGDPRHASVQPPAAGSLPTQSHRSPLVVVLVGSPHRSRWSIEVRPSLAD